MKRTIISLLALTGMASADTLTISNANNTATTTGDWFTTLSAGVTITAGSQDFTATDYTNSFYSVATNVGSGGSYTYTLTFNLKQNLILESLTTDIFFYNSAGGAQGKDRAVKCGISILDEANTTPLYNVSDITKTSNQGNVDSNGTVVYFDSAYDQNGTIAVTAEKNRGPRYVQVTPDDMSPITLSSGATYKMNIDIAKGDNLGGAFIGIGNMTLSGRVVPEPTTATLSLLALAGLAARRRRR